MTGKRKPTEGLYSPVSRRIWDSADFNALSAPVVPSAQFLFLRMLTTRDQTPVPGLYVMRLGGIAEQYAWDLSETRACFQEILDRKSEETGLAMAEYDHQTGLVWLPNAINHRAPDNGNVVLGWRMSWRELPRCALKERAREHMRAWCEQRGKEWLSAFDSITTVNGRGNGSPNGSGNRGPNPGGNRDMDREREKETDPKQQPDLDLEASARVEPVDLQQRRHDVNRIARHILLRMRHAVGDPNAYDFNVFRSELHALASKHPEDLERALVTYETDKWPRENKGKATPEHFLRKFEDYVDGTIGKGLKGAMRAPRAEDIEEIDELGVG